MPARPEFGRLLQDWRRQRRLSQLELALLANVSQRHVAFLETGRAGPSRQMILTLATALEVPLRRRNELLRAAGFAARYAARALDEPSLAPIRAAIKHLLDRHEPYPAIVLDRHWSLIDANRAAKALFAPLLSRAGPEPNLIRLLIEIPEIEHILPNWRELAMDLGRRLKLEAAHQGGDAELVALGELIAASVGDWSAQLESGDRVVPRVTIRNPAIGEVSLFPLFAEFGTIEDITVHDLRLELFFPADPESAERLYASRPRDDA